MSDSDEDLYESADEDALPGDDVNLHNEIKSDSLPTSQFPVLSDLAPTPSTVSPNIEPTFPIVNSVNVVSFPPVVLTNALDPEPTNSSLDASCSHVSVKDHDSNLPLESSLPNESQVLSTHDSETYSAFNENEEPSKEPSKISNSEKQDPCVQQSFTTNEVHESTIEQNLNSNDWDNDFDFDELDLNNMLKTSIADSETQPKQTFLSSLDKSDTNNLSGKLLSQSNKDLMVNVNNENPTSNKTSSWGGWGQSLIFAATQSVSSVASHVATGITSALEGVEGSLSIPPPEQLAATKCSDEVTTSSFDQTELPDQNTDKNISQANTDESSWWSGWTGVVASTAQKTASTYGKSVLTGGIDVLEAIGKKTMNIIQENDPGFQKTKSLIRKPLEGVSGQIRNAEFGKSKSSLSSILREAQEIRESSKIDTTFDEKCENSNRNLIVQSQNTGELSPCSVSMLFSQSIAFNNLTALELLSEMNEQKLSVMKVDSSTDRQTLSQIVALFEKLEDEDDENEDEHIDSDDGADYVENPCESKVLHKMKVSLSCYKESLKVAAFKDLFEVRDNGFQNLYRLFTECVNKEVVNITKLHAGCIKHLVDYTSASIVLLHKIGEFSCQHIQQQQLSSSQEASLAYAQDVVSCSMLLIKDIKTQGQLLVKTIKTGAMTRANEEAVIKKQLNQCLASIFLEISNCCSYIKDATHLLSPILQYSLLLHR